MSIFVILLIIFFGALVLYDARMKNIEQMTNDEYDLQIYKNEQELKDVKQKYSGITKEFEKLSDEITKNNDTINSNIKKMDEIENTKSSK